MKLDDIGIRLDQISTQLKVLEVRTEGVSRMSGDVELSLLKTLALFRPKIAAPVTLADSCL